MKSACLLLASACSALFAAVPSQAQTVGVSAAVNQNARSTRPGSAVRTIVLGDNVVHNERIETDTIGLLQILLADGTTFTVGPNSALSIDRFVYDPNAGTAEVGATLTKGVFRFIGGKTSKTPGGVTLATPVGTIGIRGAMADMNVGGGSQGNGPVTAHFDLKYGKELTLDTPGGDTQRIFEPGYSIIISKNPDGSEKREIRRTPPEMANEIQDELSGAPGTSGGSSRQPTDQTVIVSGIATENSDRPPFVNDPPVPTARPSDGNEARTEEAIVQQASRDLTRDEVAETITEASVPEIPVVPPPGPSDPVTDATIISFGILTAGATYEVSNGDVILNPGAVGLAGGSPDTDLTAPFKRADGSRFAVGTILRGTLTLPIFDDAAFRQRNLSASDGACLAAIEMTRVLETLNEGRETELKIGIGLNSGLCCVGNLGSAQRFSYSAIGDGVNVASRVEGLTKAYGLSIIVTENVRSGAAGLAFLSVDLVRVVGRREPLPIFALIGDDATVTDPAFEIWQTAHEAMVAAYRTGRFDEAQRKLRLAKAVDGQDRLAAVYALYTDRLATLRTNLPGPDWDGVFEAHEK